MKRILIILAILAIAVTANAYTWPGAFPYDGLIVNDRAGLPMPSRSIHLYGSAYYYGMINKNFDNDGESVEDVRNYNILGGAFSGGYTFDGLWSFDVTAQLSRRNTKGYWDDPDADDPTTPEDERTWNPDLWEHETGIGDLWVKVRKLFIAGDGFYVGPRIAAKFDTGKSQIHLGDGQVDIDGGLVFAKYDDNPFKFNGQAGFRYRLTDEYLHFANPDTEGVTPGSMIYTYVEPGFGVGDDQRFIFYVPIGFDYHMESKEEDRGLGDDGYGVTVGIKPSFAINDNHTINATVLYPAVGKSIEQELYVGLSIDSFIPLPEPVKDWDQDGILDNVDACPKEPEDFDNFEDSDGCPDPDNDNDGILDNVDKCPNEAENFNDFEDTDGCPDTAPELEKEIILDDLRFVPESTELISGSYTSLDKAGKTMKDNPEVKVLIEGHAADTGRPDFELKLSEGRAENVKDYIVDKYGIDPGRIATKGFGSTQPIADNSTEEGKRRNRRIEFVIK